MLNFLVACGVLCLSAALLCQCGQCACKREQSQQNGEKGKKQHNQQRCCHCQQKPGCVCPKDCKCPKTKQCNCDKKCKCPKVKQCKCKCPKKEKCKCQKGKKMHDKKKKETSDHKKGEKDISKEKHKNEKQKSEKPKDKKTHDQNPKSNKQCECIKPFCICKKMNDIQACNAQTGCKCNQAPCNCVGTVRFNLDESEHSLKPLCHELGNDLEDEECKPNDEIDDDIEKFKRNNNIIITTDGGVITLDSFE